jgi:hypothetical protein
VIHRLLSNLDRKSPEYRDAYYELQNKVRVLEGNCQAAVTNVIAGVTSRDEFRRILKLITEFQVCRYSNSEFIFLIFSQLSLPLRNLLIRNLDKDSTILQDLNRSINVLQSIFAILVCFFDVSVVIFCCR